MWGGRLGTSLTGSVPNSQIGEDGSILEGVDMDLNYQRCPKDDAKIISADIGVSNSGKRVELGIAEIATALQIKGCIYATTLAIKGGVTEDFIARVALGLAQQMNGDIHALCPVIGMLCECSALMQGGTTAFDKYGLVNVFPSKQCPPWMRGYFDKQMEDD